MRMEMRDGARGALTLYCIEASDFLTSFPKVDVRLEQLRSEFGTGPE
jgi:hypothetical protein